MTPMGVVALSRLKAFGLPHTAALQGAQIGRRARFVRRGRVPGCLAVAAFLQQLPGRHAAGRCSVSGVPAPSARPAVLGYRQPPREAVTGPFTRDSRFAPHGRPLLRGRSKPSKAPSLRAGAAGQNPGVSPRCRQRAADRLDAMSLILQGHAARIRPSPGRQAGTPCYQGPRAVLLPCYHRRGQSARPSGATGGPRPCRSCSRSRRSPFAAQGARVGAAPVSERVSCPPDSQWRVDNPAGLDRLAAKGRLIAPGRGELAWKRYEEEIAGRQIHNLWHEQQSPTDMHYVVETAETTIERCVVMTTDPGDLVLDPTCGSGTTAAVAERWGRRWITVDASAIPVALCRQRILSSVHKWHLTLDDSEGQCEEARLAGRLEEYQRNPGPLRSGADPAAGFVYERVPYVSAAHLAYDQPPKATLLVNRPILKRGVKRISAPFTVESHSPWVYVSPSAPETDVRATERETGIRENVVNALGIVGIPASDGSGGRWRFDSIELWDDGAPSSHITHEATLRGSGDRVAIAVVPDDRTAGIALIDTAAKAAARQDFRKLVVVAFHFAADAKNEQRRKLEIVLVQANRDLTIGELKSGKEDHAFVLVGELDVEMIERSAGKWQVTIKGYNVYDPSSGNVRSGGKPADIDCWMLDTDYDGTSFFARRIHFPGKSADRQIKGLKGALGSRVDPEQWKFMESLTSAPFRRPPGGRVAVRIVTAFGDEMLSVLTLDA